MNQIVDYIAYQLSFLHNLIKIVRTTRLKGLFVFWNHEIWRSNQISILVFRFYNLQVILYYKIFYSFIFTASSKTTSETGVLLEIVIIIIIIGIKSISLMLYFFPDFQLKECKQTTWGSECYTSVTKSCIQRNMDHCIRACRVLFTFKISTTIPR